MTKKKSERIVELDRKVEIALKEYREGKHESERAAAKAHGIPPSTFNNRVKGGKSVAEAHEPFQRLSTAEEKALVNWIIRMQATGHPVRHCFIRELAQEMLHNSIVSESNGPISGLIVPADLETIGESWVQRFLHRHPNLQTIFSETIETSRLKVTKKALTIWFEVIRNVITEYDILPENMYNMDETGTAIGTLQASYVVVDKTIIQKY